MKTIEYTIKDEIGIHARPAGLLVKESKAFTSEVILSCNGKSADVKKLMALMALGVKKGDTVKVEVKGDDEDAAAAALKKFFEENL